MLLPRWKPCFGFADSSNNEPFGESAVIQTVRVLAWLAGVYGPLGASPVLDAVVPSSGPKTSSLG
jgi:hypothetical protein